MRPRSYSLQPLVHTLVLSPSLIAKQPGELGKMHIPSLCPWRI